MRTALAIRTALDTYEKAAAEEQYVALALAQLSTNLVWTLSVNASSGIRPLRVAIPRQIAQGILQDRLSVLTANAATLATALNIPHTPPVVKL